MICCTIFPLYLFFQIEYVFQIVTRQLYLPGIVLMQHQLFICVHYRKCAASRSRSVWTLVRRHVPACVSLRPCCSSTPEFLCSQCRQTRRPRRQPTRQNVHKRPRRRRHLCWCSWIRNASTNSTNSLNKYKKDWTHLSS